MSAALALGDDALVLSHRLGEWAGHAPVLEEEVALANIALDLLGQARVLLSLVGDEDELAYLREERAFRNLQLVEQPNGDFAHTIVRQFLFDAYQLLLWEDLAANAEDETLKGVAAKAIKEARYHHRFSSGWMIRLGDGTEESHRRVQAALDQLWRFTDEMFEDGSTAGYRAEWERGVIEVVAEASLEMPTDPYQRTGGRKGLHTEHLGRLLAEMQWLARSHPGATW